MKIVTRLCVKKSVGEKSVGEKFVGEKCMGESLWVKS